MSQWTHLAGIIRIDNLLRFVTPTAPIAEDVIKILLEDAPVGSEGGCLFNFVTWQTADSFEEKDHTNVHSQGTYWGDAIISADLRDIGDDDEIEDIKQWFTGLAEKFWDAKMLMRQAVLEIDVEYKYQRVLHLVDQEENTWIDTTTPKESGSTVLEGIEVVADDTVPPGLAFVVSPGAVDEDGEVDPDKVAKIENIEEKENG